MSVDPPIGFVGATDFEPDRPFIRARHATEHRHQEMTLPDTYGEDRLVFLVRDPVTVFASWEITPNSLQRVRDTLGSDARLALQLQAVHPAAEHVVSEYDVDGAHNCYVRHDGTAAAYRAVLGMRAGDRFIPLLHSRPTSTPPGKPSAITDSDWPPLTAVVTYAHGSRYVGSSRY